METQEKKKLCWNCEGGVPLSAENCPYCAVYVGPAIDTSEPAKENSTNNPYQFIDTQDSSFSQNHRRRDGEAKVSQDEGSKQFILPLTLLLVGSVFCLFGFILFIYSEHNFFTLSWKSKYWFIYLLLSLPMLVLGWFTLNRLDTD